MKDNRQSFTKNDPVPPDFPTEVTFKAIYRNVSLLDESIRQVLQEKGLDPSISSKISKNGKFISYTFTAVFPSEELLKGVCEALSHLDGFMTMF